MATVNFSVPEEVKVAFDAAFGGQNKSAVIAGLMRRAIDENARTARREQLFQSLRSTMRSRWKRKTRCSSLPTSATCARRATPAG
jgi:hypothetical protein